VLLKHVLSMDWEEALGNETLEELRVRLERWEELCAQLRGLYYRYIDLAAFRSEKCYFPGRRCKRPWGREYDLGDLNPHVDIHHEHGTAVQKANEDADRGGGEA